MSGIECSDFDNDVYDQALDDHLTTVVSGVAYNATFDAAACSDTGSGDDVSVELTNEIIIPLALLDAKYGDNALANGHSIMQYVLETLSAAVSDGSFTTSIQTYARRRLTASDREYGESDEAFARRGERRLSMADASVDSVSVDTFTPTPAPTEIPTPPPSQMPTSMPTSMPSPAPTPPPSQMPSPAPSQLPTISPYPSPIPTTPRPTYERPVNYKPDGGLCYPCKRDSDCTAHDAKGADHYYRCVHFITSDDYCCTKQAAYDPTEVCEGLCRIEQERRWRERMQRIGERRRRTRRLLSVSTDGEDVGVPNRRGADAGLEAAVDATGGVSFETAAAQRASRRQNRTTTARIAVTNEALAKSAAADAKAAAADSGKQSRRAGKAAKQQGRRRK